jgi:pimeloyl-ACP methyl ester carboxylesterase
MDANISGRCACLRSLATSWVAGLATVAVLTGTIPRAEARALDCGSFEFPHCKGADHQFDRKFKGREAFGGFGGGECKATRTPVVFIHGNADRAINWDSETAGPVARYPRVHRSIYDEFKARGYNDCELFGITYLSPEERGAPETNYHRPETYRIILAFINAVKADTGQPQVDIVAHSLGVSMTLAALTWTDERSKRSKAWNGVRRFVNIAGGLRGLDACRRVGFANPMVPTCGSQHLGDRYVFGFYPDDGAGFGRNAWTAAGGPWSLRQMPAAHPTVDFYTIHAGEHDQVHCTASSAVSSCAKGALFSRSPNVRAQLDVGAGSTASRVDLDFKDFSPFMQRGGDVDGIGHFKAKNHSGAIIYQMLNSECRGLDCKGSYVAGPVTAE